MPITIYVDADACPVKQETIIIAKEFNIPVIMIIDTSHELSDDYSTVITVDKANDSVDFEIIGRLHANDILVTQDYGLASIALAKKAHVINQNGFLYTNENIDRLLYERHLNKKLRRSGGRSAPIKKRTKENDINFEQSFRRLVLSVVSKA